MKSFYILLILCLSFTTAYSHDNINQKWKETVILSDSNVVESVKLYSTITPFDWRYSYTYNIDGNIDTNLTQQWQNQQWVNFFMD